MSLKRDRRTVVLVTHDMAAVRKYCDLAIMIDNGKIVKSGSPEIIAQAYQKLFMQDFDSKRETGINGDDDHWGNGKMICLKPDISISTEKVILSAHYKSLSKLPAPVFGFSVFNKSGDNIMEGNTQRLNHKTKVVNNNETVDLNWEFPNIFSTGTYSVSVACCDQSTTEYYDWFNNAVTFEILKEHPTSGITDPIIKISKSTYNGKKK